MPEAPAHPCRFPMCPGLLRRGEAACTRGHPAPRAFDRARRSPEYGPAWRRLSRRLRRESGSCEVCGGPAEVVDHIQPRRQGGPDDEGNARVLCRRCHARVTGRDLAAQRMPSA